MQQLRRLLWDEGGATAVEYALIAAAIAAVIATVAVSLGSKVEASFRDMSGKMPGGAGS